MLYHFPNFLIVGVAKSGTSSLHQYLNQHPDIFMTQQKEPRFITSQIMDFPLNGPGDARVESWYIKDFETYKKLFITVKEEKIIGESSADTFYFHEKTIPIIKKYFGNPKILIILRNPVERAYSAYQHLRRDSREDLSFEEGLNNEKFRIKNNYELIYHYKEVSKYSEGLQNFYNNFDNVKVILSEDLSKNTHSVFKDIFNFLSIDPQVEIDITKRYNFSGIPRNKWLHEFVFYGNPSREFLRPFLRFFFSKERREKMYMKIQKINLAKTEIDHDTRLNLVEFFKKDILKTQKLINRDLSNWLK